MNADFAEEKQQMKDAHSAEVESLNHKFNDAEAEHNTYVAKLNADLPQGQMKPSKSILKSLQIKKKLTRRNLLKLRKPTLNHQPQAMPLTLLSLKRLISRLTKRLSLQKKLVKSV